MSDDELETVGWDAITATLLPLYGDQEPRHWAPALYARIGGSDPLDGISVYSVADPPHWHFVSYGMSELYGKESDDPEVSGWGFEFTLRLRRHDEAEPPGWALSFLNNLARYVFQTGNIFDVGDHMDLNGPIALGNDTNIRAIAFQADPRLGTIHTPHGRITFLQVVGLTMDEFEVVQDWDAEKVLLLLAQRDPLLLTDVRRASWLGDPTFAREAREGSQRDGSSETMTFVAKVEWDVGVEARVRFGANAVRRLARLLPQRLSFGKPFALIGKEQVVRFEPAEVVAWHAEEDAFVICLPATGVSGFCERLPVRRGSYRWEELPGLEVTIVPSEIKDRDGKTIEVIG